MIAGLLGNALFVAVAAPLLWLATRAFPRPAVAHALWVLLLVKFITPPLWTVPVPIPGADVVAQVNRHWTGLAAGVWMAGSAVVIWSMLRRGEAFRQVVAARGDYDPHASDLAERVDPGGPLFRTPPVMLVDAVHSPMLCGVGPCCWILFPRALWRALSVEGRGRLLAHELAHFRRGDCFVRLLEMATTALFWWHPMLWLVRAQLHRAEEDCCDAIAANAGARSYAEAMLLTLDFLNDPNSLPQERSAAPWAGACPLLGSRSGVEARLRRIMRRSVRADVSPRARVILALAACAILSWSPTPVHDAAADAMLVRAMDAHIDPFAPL